MPDTPDQKLVEKARRGDHGALGQLLQDHQQRLYNVVLRMVGQRDDAADVTQDAMVKIVEHINDFRGQSNISTWMVRIAMNLSFSHLRKRRSRRTTSLDDGNATTTGSHGNDQSTPLRQQLADTREPPPDSRVQQSEMVNQLFTALNDLQDDLRAVLVLRDIDQMDYHHIADVLSIPVGTVKSRLFRARLALRQQMVQCTTPPATKRSSNKVSSLNGEEGPTHGSDRAIAPR